MILEVILYETVTTAISLLGLQALKGAGLKKRLARINGPKPIPVVDHFLRRELGPVTKTERYIATKFAKFVNRVSQYEAFRLLSILIVRRIRASQMGQSNSSIGGARRLSRRFVLAA